MMNWIKTVDRVLKGDATRPEALRGGTLDVSARGLGVAVVVLGVVYGACMGSFALAARWDTTTRSVGYLQMLASAAKVPLLFALTLVITFPSLYVFNALIGSRLTFPTVGRLLLAAAAVTMAVLASFGTIVVFFSLCTTSYPFMVLLNVATFGVAGLLGMRFLLQALGRLSGAPGNDAAGPAAPAPAAVAVEGSPPSIHPPAGPRPAAPRESSRATAVFRVWVIVFGLVGAQMAWVLRPFIGSPTAPFSFFRERDSNVFEAIVGKVEQVLTGEGSRRRAGGWGGPDGGRQGAGTGRTAPPAGDGR